MRLSSKHGLNPSIPLCHYCKKPKNEIILTGYEGEKWAKKNGYPDGQMPMYILLKGDIQPCDECKKIGIAVVEVKSDADRELTGRRWLMKEEAIKKILIDSSMLSRVLQKRILIISAELAQNLGL